jgi:hypothetical protein
MATKQHFLVANGVEIISLAFSGDKTVQLVHHHDECIELVLELSAVD